jgi:flagellar motility protein MotE (MotC chaperone)
MKKLLTSTWMTMLIGVVIYIGATALFWKTPAVTPAAASPSPESEPHASLNGPSWDFINPEADQLLAEIKVEKKSLAKKEQELNELSTRLQAERAELSLVTQSVQHMQTDFDQNVLRIREEETANLKKLAKVYADMSADGAAAIFAELDDSSVVKIMTFMKDSETAAILEALSKKGQPQAKRAANLSERLRLAMYRNPPAK